MSRIDELDRIPYQKGQRSVVLKVMTWWLDNTAAAFDAGSADRYPELQGAIQRLTQRLARAEAQIEALQKRHPGAELQVYRVDTAAGMIRCESCRFEEK